MRSPWENIPTIANVVRRPFAVFAPRFAVMAAGSEEVCPLKPKSPWEAAVLGARSWEVSERAM
eukprot:13962528-Heterocapsa_arctica.AAC.1